MKTPERGPDNMEIPGGDTRIHRERTQKYGDSGMRHKNMETVGENTTIWRHREGIQV